VKKNVKDGIDKVKRRKINIINSCVNTIREIKNYSWRKKGDTILDEPVKFDDHAMDALRYAITGYFEQSKPNIYVLDI
jgi:phage terminase large subunit